MLRRELRRELRRAELNKGYLMTEPSFDVLLI